MTGPRGWATVIAVVAFGMSGAAPALARGVPDSFADLAQRLTPAVVSISIRSQPANAPGSMPRIPQGSPFEDLFREFFERYGNPAPSPRETMSLGSGFVIDPAGYVVTNNHVIEQAEVVTVRLDDGAELAARVVGVDAKTDIALLKVDPAEPLPHVEFGDSDAVRVGDWVMAIGNPFGFGNSVTAGIISARQRDIRAGPYDDFLQTDAPINRGNSGGPLFDMEGKVVGVNTAIYSPSGGSVGIGFAVPSLLAVRVVDQLREFGRTRRGWLGVRIQDVTPEIAEALDLPEARGALVAGVTPDGPAAAAGLLGGDVIIVFDGQPIENMRKLPRVVAAAEVGGRVEVVVLRGGGERVFEVVLGELESFEEDQGRAARPRGTEVLGMTLQPMSPELARRFSLDPDRGGLVVIEVAPGGAAERAGMIPGDVLLQVGRTPLIAADDIAREVALAREKGARSVVVLVARGDDAEFRALGLDG